MDYEVAVIGAGPGGLVSSLYLRRFLRRTILLSAGPPRASWIPKTHNLFGFRDGVSGVQLLKQLQGQLDDLGIERAVGQYRVSKSRGGFRVQGESGESFTAKKVILATGMTDVQPLVGNLDLLRRRGLLRYCPVCDAFEYRDKKIVVLAQDDHGLKTARFLSRFTDSIQVLWPPSQPLPMRLVKTCMREKVKFTRGILKSVVEPKGKGTGLAITYVDADQTQREMKADACYVALGITVNDFAFRSLKGIERGEGGYLITGSHQEIKKIPGLFAVGDCVEGLAQIATAAGQAAVAATRIHNELRAP